ncbi:flagellar P-ring protein [Novimethylophilus kurashikiensis]|uniref:Flagellar P-ring protein n=1 Tax=Novimethylophilus kurashikiensis TaxID=1825523 RepID=A0A2R5FAE6_9PROT|nr:zonular occludens toxin domain-containing protein [Novimethylophilus kurashikiensis]GBG15202.1 flagellar P-ring protein [Novimethylophilus kurashikiensis]
MAVYFVTGKLGAGKSLAAIQRIRDYAANGNKIAGNLDVYLDKLCTNPRSKVSYIRIPDRPTAADLYALGEGKPSDDYDEEHNGLLVLDELVTWLNSRSWNDKGRKDLIDWFVHARKFGWDIIFLVQSIEAVDKQLIDTLMEYHVPVINLSKINIPVIGRLYKHFNTKGKPLRLPKVHIAHVMYLDKISADRWTFRAMDLYAAYDTKQVISENYPHGPHSQLSRWHLEGRYLPPENNLQWRDVLILPAALLIYAACRLFQHPVPVRSGRFESGSAGLRRLGGSAA